MRGVLTEQKSRQSGKNGSSAAPTGYCSSRARANGITNIDSPMLAQWLQQPNHLDPYNTISEVLVAMIHSGPSPYQCGAGDQWVDKREAAQKIHCVDKTRNLHTVDRQEQSQSRTCQMMKTLSARNEKQWNDMRPKSTDEQSWRREDVGGNAQTSNDPRFWQGRHDQSSQSHDLLMVGSLFNA